MRRRQAQSAGEGYGEGHQHEPVPFDASVSFIPAVAGALPASIRGNSPCRSIH